jgi:hypothetical protein
VFYLVLKSGDLGGKPVNRNLQVSDYSGKYVRFNVSRDSGSLFLM